jgi:hypothetical protein
MSGPRRRRLAGLGIAALLGAALPGAAPAGAQQSPRDSSAFVRLAREAAERYEARSTAIADGYRRVGPDFPAMGEHWVQPGRLVSGRVDPASPPILSYVEVQGRPRLVGVAYAVPLAPGQSPPPFPRPDAWHDHTGTVDQESLLVGPLGAGPEAGGSQLAMLHVWIPADNPAGVFAQHNWSLPLIRLGLEGGTAPPEHAARSLSLLNGGAGYYTRLLTAAAGPDVLSPARAGALVEPARASVAALLEGRPPGPLSPAEIGLLVQEWEHFLDRVAASLPDPVGARVRRLLAGEGRS